MNTVLTMINSKIKKDEWWLNKHLKDLSLPLYKEEYNKQRKERYIKELKEELEKLYELRKKVCINE